MFKKFHNTIIIDYTIDPTNIYFFSGCKTCNN